jgi:hypothetical protein
MILMISLRCYVSLKISASVQSFCQIRLNLRYRGVTNASSHGDRLYRMIPRILYCTDELAGHVKQCQNLIHAFVVTAPLHIYRRLLVSCDVKTGHVAVMVGVSGRGEMVGM